MATFSIHARRAEDAARNAKLIAGLALEPAAPKFERPVHHVDGGDERTLRGIPAIGRGCPGRINGSMPGQGPLFNESVRPFRYNHA